MRVALYRVFYAEDFIVESVKSVLDHVDHVLICWMDRPWTGATTCSYKCKMTSLKWRPDAPYDRWYDRVRAMDEPKIKCVKFSCDRPDDQYSTMANLFLRQMFGRFPDTLICMEWDHVWRSDQIEKAIREFEANGYKAARTRQVELWKDLNWRVPERANRTGVVFWNLSDQREMPLTKKQAEPRGTDFEIINAHVHNCGFLCSDETMLRKHLVALANAQAGMKDSKPREDWYDRVWLKWTPEMENLEISEGYEHTIPRAIPYAAEMCPRLLIEKFRDPFGVQEMKVMGVFRGGQTKMAEDEE